MKILIMTQHYAPEEVRGAVLGTELAEDLVLTGKYSGNKNYIKTIVQRLRL